MSGRGFFRPRLVSGSREGPRGDEPIQARTQADQFRRIMLPHMDAAYSYARYLSRDAAAAEDIAQNAFVRAIRGFDRWRGDNPKAWLLAIVRNCHLEMVGGRRDPLRGAEPIEAADDCAAAMSEAESLEDGVARRQDAAMLRQTIEDLPEPFRETLILRELEELSYKEIAAITEVPIGTVMSRLARARAMLGALLLPSSADRWEAQS
ncbi:MAG: sigma-70 family RNA polymerase sigma factor [Caulobacteraceae bacterium]|nr:sigma-70 family RNA polymerase sigma factor [Caulobacteraceae bacterium]